MNRAFGNDNLTTVAIGRSDAEEAVRTVLRFIGYDPGIEGLLDTPRRVLASLSEFTSGAGLDPGLHLARVFQADDMDVDAMIVLRHIPFTSVCEHHLLPFFGYASVAYIPSPGAAVVGLSKLARVVEGYARRLQVQERMTAQVAKCLDVHIDNVGVAVTLQATHTCMSMRGVRKESAVMVTSKLTGAFREDPRARAEFFELVKQ